jgi:hypothetical protein
MEIRLNKYMNIKPLNNRDRLYDFRSKLNSNFSELYSSLSAVSGIHLTSIYSSITALSAKIGTGGGSGGATFTTDITVSLSNNKTFGKYKNGETIPAIGKTASEVILMATGEPLEPTVSLTSSTVIEFNQTAISNVLDFSHTINTLGARVASASLEWRRNGTGAWYVLSTSTNATDSYTHTLTDTNYNTQPFNYRYTVTDSAGATKTITKDITPVAYAAPTIPINVVGVSIASPESNLIREKGNVESNISGSVTKNSVNITLTNYTLQYKVNGGLWVDIGSIVTITGNSVTIAAVNHNPTSSAGADTITYRIKVVDSFQTSYSGESTITFKYIVYYGSSASAPTDSAGVRALTNKIFSDGTNPVILYTGTSNTKFTIAMPSTLSLNNAIDLDASNAPLTNSYVNNSFSVNDAGGTATSYKVYTLTLSTPYSPDQHRHQITRG